MKIKRAFTLLELLIAASIFSIIILSIYSAFQTGFLSYRKVDSAFELYQTVRLLFNRMELDLKNAFAYGDAEGNSRFIGKLDPLSLEFFSVVDSYAEGEPRTDISRIKYELKELEDKNKKLIKKLIRANYKGLDALKTGIQQEGVEVASNIEKVTFEYAYPTENEGKPSFEWQDSWPADDKEEQKTNLPLAVKIVLTFPDGTEFTKIVPLMTGGSEKTNG